MNDQELEAPELNPDVIEAVDAYLKLLGKKKLPPAIAAAVQEIRTEYTSTSFLRPTQVALLQRCFYRARAGQYEVDPLPINILDLAIAQELDGQPLRMLRGDEIALAIDWLAFDGTHTAEEEEWHGQVQDQLLLTGWLAQSQLAELKHRNRESTRRVASRC